MKRTQINPWNWSLNIGYSQAELISGAQQILHCSGQTSVDEHGAPQHIDNMRAQMTLALENLESVLTQAGMGLQDVSKITVYTTDVDATLQNYDVIGARFGAHNVTPPTTLLGIHKLAVPGLMFELDATAVK